MITKDGSGYESANYEKHENKLSVKLVDTDGVAEKMLVQYTLVGKIKNLDLGVYEIGFYSSTGHEFAKKIIEIKK